MIVLEFGCLMLTATSFWGMVRLNTPIRVVPRQMGRMIIMKKMMSPRIMQSVFLLFPDGGITVVATGIVVFVSSGCVSITQHPGIFWIFPGFKQGSSTGIPKIHSNPANYSCNIVFNSHPAVTRYESNNISFNNCISRNLPRSYNPLKIIDLVSEG